MHDGLYTGIHVHELLISIKADTINFSKKYLQNFY